MKDVKVLKKNGGLDSDHLSVHRWVPAWPPEVLNILALGKFIGTK